ncbi:putative propanediol utilization polyhedral bodies protein [Yersinia enterocolitica]|uniref:Propanediol utilization protein: polyhedral bodies n=1 Tax=Yersinia enterocolitica serotype O:8 / biotype 1B (strain NCTC 13174 / 8081) TaxID=393305 RepID=A1JTS8_YERE8|nr:BMC domain-containing protein [Yersinia enterocolitica]AJI82757.1 BMC domain protein [Yersinia enterocolitica]AJJ23636.1 BMC domain protein [Yersinia enterocolitica]EKA28396.1 putative propanediol utilization polyhedral bodies protein [Yersinia enterocolitica subsp. enterocolitica WA-314]ELI8282521.1 BMC domain-containing protein [Yersinia enterocolitica]KGA74314.1 BMC domain protein [Yersinia enterocolitica]
MKTSLGLLEVSGLALAIGAADVMAKAASVTLIGIEKTNGSGWMLIRLTGDVASVQAAISTGAAFAQLHQGLVSSAVLARPADPLMAYWQAPHIKPAATEATTLSEPAQQVVAEMVMTESPTIDKCDEAEAPRPADTATDDEPEIALGVAIMDLDVARQSAESEAPPAPRVSCNLCLDPACRRHKGEPRFRCIHLGKRGKV